MSTMADEEKKDVTAESTEEAQAETETNADAETGESTDETGTATENSQFDYEAELKAEKERAQKAEKAAADLAFKLREQKRKESDEEAGDDESDDDKPITAKQLKQILSENAQQVQKQLQQTAIVDKVSKLAKSDGERNLIIEIHKNRTFPAGMSLDEQIEEAWVIANRKRLILQNEELKRALSSKETSTTNSAGTYRQSPKSTEPKMSAQDANAIKQAGFVWDGAKGMWKKPLRGGKVFLYKNPKTGVLFRAS